MEQSLAKIEVDGDTYYCLIVSMSGGAQTRVRVTQTQKPDIINLPTAKGTAYNISLMIPLREPQKLFYYQSKDKIMSEPSSLTWLKERLTQWPGKSINITIPTEEIIIKGKIASVAFTVESMGHRDHLVRVQLSVVEIR